MLNPRVRPLLRLVLMLATALVLSGVYSNGVAQALTDSQLFSRAREIPRLIREGTLKVAEIPDPHWRSDACQACHRGDPRAKPVRLNDQSVVKVCNNCHSAVFDHSYIHPVDVVPSREMIQRMPDSYRAALKRSGGSLSCITCHDLPMQSQQQRRPEQARNPLFFRGGPFRTRTEQCYLCHDAQSYQRLNAHDQITAGGRVREVNCRLCHAESSDASQVNRGVGPLQYMGTADPLTLCTRCHTYKPHPGGGYGIVQDSGVNHLVVPSDGILQKMKTQAEQTGLDLPLVPGSGSVACWTCHEPHLPGVVKGRDSSGQFVAKSRIRAPGLCLRCHDL